MLRIKRPEGLKERPPGEFGRVLGLDRAPEVKTLRRKLARLAAFGRAAEFGRALARRRAASRGAALGFLYVDGHVRAYHGRHPIAKAHVARMRISMPATTDYWVGDASGEPLLVITAEANAGLVKTLPRVLDEVRLVVGERRLTIVFDRGGWSPRLFAQILDGGFDILTYPQGAETAGASARSTATVTSSMARPRPTGWPTRPSTCDCPPTSGSPCVRSRVWPRTAATDPHRHLAPGPLTALEIARRMFDRWRQENFFKYLRDEYALDALYDVDPDDPQREVPNPARKVLDIELRATRAALAELRATYGAAALDNPEQTRPTMRFQNHPRQDRPRHPRPASARRRSRSMPLPRAPPTLPSRP